MVSTIMKVKVSAVASLGSLSNSAEVENVSGP